LSDAIETVYSRMRRYASRLCQLAAALLVIVVVSARLVVSLPDDDNSTFWPPIDSSHLKMEARSDYDEDGKDVSPKTISEISLNVESSLKVKTNDRPIYPPNPVVLPRSTIESRNKGSNVGSSAATKDSYLDALEYSHRMKEDRTYVASPPAFVKQDYVPRPVYRGEDSNNSSGSNGNRLGTCIS
jgi:hypothetical protein